MENTQLLLPNTIAASYKFNRLCFKRSIIEKLALTDKFEVVTPTTTFQLTRGQFESTFASILVTRSWLEGGVYHFPTAPKKALQFKVAQ